MFRSLIFALALVFATVTAAQAATNVAIAPLMQVAEKSNLQDAKTKYLDSKFGKDKSSLEKDVKAFQKKAEEFQKQASALSETAR